MVLEETVSLWYRVLCARYGEEVGRLSLGVGRGYVLWQTVNNIRGGWIGRWRLVAPKYWLHGR